MLFLSYVIYTTSYLSVYKDIMLVFNEFVFKIRIICDDSSYSDELELQKYTRILEKLHSSSRIDNIIYCTLYEYTYK